MSGEPALWPEDGAGVLTLPSGRRVRGRGLRSPAPSGMAPQFGLYCTGKQPPPVAWPARWIHWPDFWLPTDRAGAAGALAEAWRRSGGERVEVACTGGRGRTGTALACLAVLDGLDGAAAIAHVRAHYDRHAIETPWQARFVRSLARSLNGDRQRRAR